MVFEQIKLPYSYEALEPVVDTATMHVHYDKHHKTYTDKFNASIVDNKLESKTMEELFSSISKLPSSIRNNGGGFWNHNFFFEALSPKIVPISDKLKLHIDKEFGSVEKCLELLSTISLNHFGSGWGWIGYNSTSKKIEIFSTPNQDNSLMDIWPTKIFPLLCLDVWEHAYYLKYQNRRADWIKEYLKIINWDIVNKRFEDALLGKVRHPK